MNKTELIKQTSCFRADFIGDQESSCVKPISNIILLSNRLQFNIQRKIQYSTQYYTYTTNCEALNKNVGNIKMQIINYTYTNQKHAYTYIQLFKWQTLTLNMIKY